MNQPFWRLVQQSDALGRRNQADAGEKNVEWAEGDFTCSQAAHLTKAGNGADRKKRHARDASADSELREESRR